MKKYTLIFLIFSFFIMFSKYSNDYTFAHRPYDHIMDYSDDNWKYLNEFKNKKKYSKDELYCLQQNIFFEAATENTNGRLAVGLVTLNRVKSKRFPNTICEVVKQSKRDRYGNPIRNKCHFSWYCNGLSDKPILKNSYEKKVWKDIKELSFKLVNNEYENLVGNSTHYHRIDVYPNWADNLHRYSRIGSHVFYYY